MLPFAAAVLLYDDTDTDNELNDGDNEVLNNLLRHEEDDSNLPMLLEADISTMDSSNDTEELEASSTITDDDSSIINLDSDDEHFETVRPILDNSNEELVQPAKRFRSDDSEQLDEFENFDSADPALKCPICLGAWTSEGNHRLCALRCGHLFGHKCIKQWLLSINQSNKRCPQCNAKASMKHIRFLYATKLACKDNSELEKLRKENEEAKSNNEKLSKALGKEKKRAKKYKQMYNKYRTFALTADSDFSFSD